MAGANGHTFDRWIISHEGRAAGRCTVCGAHAYVDTVAPMPVVDGEVIDEARVGVWAPPESRDVQRFGTCTWRMQPTG